MHGVGAGQGTHWSSPPPRVIRALFDRALVGVANAINGLECGATCGKPLPLYRGLPKPRTEAGAEADATPEPPLTASSKMTTMAVMLSRLPRCRQVLMRLFITPTGLLGCCAHAALLWHTRHTTSLGQDTGTHTHTRTHTHSHSHTHTHSHTHEPAGAPP